MIIVLIFIIPFQQMVIGRPAFHINAVPCAFVFMWIGYLYNHVQHNIESIMLDKILIKEIVMVLLIYVGISISYIYPGNVANINNYMYIIGASATVLAIYIFTSIFDSKLFAWWGKNSMIILGLHNMVLGFFRNFIQDKIFIKWNGPLVNFVLTGLVMVVLSGLIVLWNCLYKYIKFFK